MVRIPIENENQITARSAAVRPASGVGAEPRDFRTTLGHQLRGDVHAPERRAADGVVGDDVLGGRNCARDPVAARVDSGRL